MNKLIKIPEWLAIERLKNYIDECDGNELARLLGEIFGGKCGQDIESENYDFEPNEYYSGEFDDLKTKRNTKKGVK